MKKNDLRDILNLVKTKLSRETEAACGLLWADDDPGEGEMSSLYSVGEEDAVIGF